MEQLAELGFEVDSCQKLYVKNLFALEFREEAKIQNTSDVLLIEHDHNFSAVIAESLSRCFRMHSVSRESGVYNIAQELLPDIILFEATSNVIEASEFGRLLHNNSVTSHIPLVFILENASEVDEVNLLSAGAIDCLVWPFSLKSLQIKLSNIIENNARIKEKTTTSPDHASSAISKTPEEEFLEKIISVINSYIDDPDMDVKKLSETLFMTSNHVYRKIKAITGCTAKEFIRLHRLKTAANLLMQRRRTVSEIAYMVGFSTPSYFTKCFREHYECTPSEFVHKQCLLYSA